MSGPVRSAPMASSREPVDFRARETACDPNKNYS